MNYEINNSEGNKFFILDRSKKFSYDIISDFINKVKCKDGED